MDPIDLAKEHMVCGLHHNYDLWSHFSLPLDVVYHL